MVDRSYGSDRLMPTSRPLRVSSALQSKLPAHLRPAAAAASGGTLPQQPQQPASITVDFGSPDSQPQPQQRQAPPAAAPAPPRARPTPAAPKVVAVKPAAAAAPPARAATKPAPAAGAHGTEAAAPAAGGSSGGLPSRLAGRLGPPVAAAAEEQPGTRRQVCAGPGMAGLVCSC